MRTLRKLLFAAALVAGVASAGYLRAQPTDPAEAPADEAPADEAPADEAPADEAPAPAEPANAETPAESPEVTVPLEVEANLSPGEMSQRSNELIDGMQQSLRRAVELQSFARRQKDVIKLNCVNDKLLQIKQLLNIAEGARTDLIEAIALESEPDRYHQYGQITIADEKVQTLREEAEACVGEELVFLGPTEVTVDQPELPDDPTDEGFGDWSLEPPGYASPYL